jgi:hypothetical protein
VILLLEDDTDRVLRFTRALRAIDRSLAMRVWRSAWDMSREVDAYLANARLISLDHDLDPPPGETSDPGDGLAAVRALVRFPQTCPVIIHSSNRTRSEWMAGEFELAGWAYRRVAPIGENWIEEYWQSVVRELIGSQVS